MKFFLDTAGLDELKKAAAWGIIDGVTTNPSLIAREGVPIGKQIRRICAIVDGDVRAVPLIRDGIKVCAALRYDFENQVLAASLRRLNYVIDSVLAGAHVGTAPFKIYDALCNHPLMDQGLEQLLKDYREGFVEATVAV